MNWASANARSVRLDHIGRARRQAGCFAGKVFQCNAPVLPDARHYIAGTDYRNARLIIDVPAAMATSDVKDRSGFLNGNVIRLAVRTDCGEVGLSTVRTLKRFHISSLVWQFPA